MKKNSITISFLFFLFFSNFLTAQSASNKWAILGQELGSYDLTEGTAVNNKGEIVWTQSHRQWDDFGWDLRDIDLSDYDGVKIVIDDNSPEIPIDSVKLDNGYSNGHWIFQKQFQVYSFFILMEEIKMLYGALLMKWIPNMDLEFSSQLQVQKKI